MHDHNKKASCVAMEFSLLPFKANKASVKNKSFIVFTLCFLTFDSTGI